jgi:pimeloyl-ACP methyl ester carboxylesterase
MPSINANGVSLEYERFGQTNNPAILLIMGLGAQLTLWPVELLEALVGHGFQVIRYDNRDIGLSTKFDTAGLPDLAAVTMAVLSGRKPELAYTLEDMAGDAAALLDALDVAQAHIVGASMGGMIAQLVAAHHPQKTLSLTSIMSTTGNPALPPGSPEAMAVLMERPQTADEATIVEFGVRTARTIGSPAYPAEEGRLRERVTSDFRRSFSPAGMARQMAAIVANGDRRPVLRRIAAPTLVIHGDADPLVPLSGGEDTAASIPGAALHVIAGMGHDLPVELTGEIAGAIARHARSARPLQS